MKKLIIFFTCSIFVKIAVAQTESFDLATYAPLKGWKKEKKSQLLQYSKEDKTKGIYCIVTLYKAFDAASDPVLNFTNSWTSLVKQQLNINDGPQLQELVNENGWNTQSGFANFKTGDYKGVALLISATNNSQVVNILILTNTDAYESETTSFLESINLKNRLPQNLINDPITSPASTLPIKDKFTFSSTNWDDGWVSTVKEDWVEVKKGNTTVLLHYPNKNADAYNSVLKEQDINAWNMLVASRYNNRQNFEWKTIQSYESISFMEADATEIATGKYVHITLFKKHYSNGNGRYLEFITDTKADYEREFGPYHATEFDWDKTANMQYRNKLAVAAGDLTGTWTTSDYAAISYYYTSTGSFAGTSTTSTSDEFTFFEDNTYKSQHSGASGQVGNLKFSNQVYKGKSIVSNWNITLTNRFEGATEKYDCYFEAIKGGRVLLMTDRLNTTRALVKK